MERSHSPPPTLRRRTRPGSTILLLPTREDVDDFREKRLLIHLHEQLCEQLEHDPSDWQLHFQLANLMAFTDYFASVDPSQCEAHYQEALKLLRKLHTDDYADFEHRRQTTIALDIIADSDPIKLHNAGLPILTTPTRDSDSGDSDPHTEEKQESQTHKNQNAQNGRTESSGLPVMERVATPTIMVTDHQNKSSIISSNNHTLTNFIMIDGYFSPTEEELSDKEITLQHIPHQVNKPVLHNTFSSKSAPDLSITNSLKSSSRTSRNSGISATSRNSGHSSGRTPGRTSGRHSGLHRPRHRVQHSADDFNSAADMKRKWQRAKERAKKKPRKIRKRGTSKHDKEVVFVQRSRSRRKHKHHKRPKPVMKSRSLKIVVINHQQQVSDEIFCEYTSPLSEDEIQRENDRKYFQNRYGKRKGTGSTATSTQSSSFLDPEEREHYKRKSCDIDVSSIAAQYLNSVSQSRTPQHRKRPSIIAMLTGDDRANYTANGADSPSEPGVLTRSTSNSLNKRRTGSVVSREVPNGRGGSIGSASSLKRAGSAGSSGSEILAIEDEEYMVPLDIIIGYTQCYFGYGKYLTQSHRIGEGVEHLLDCCAWYDTSK